MAVHCPGMAVNCGGMAVHCHGMAVHCGGMAVHCGMVKAGEEGRAEDRGGHWRYESRYWGH